MNRHIEKYTKAAEGFAESVRVSLLFIVVSLLGTPLSLGLAIWAFASMPEHPVGQVDTATQLQGYGGLLLLIVPFALWGAGVAPTVLESVDKRREMKQALQKLENYDEFVNDLEALELEEQPV